MPLACLWTFCYGRNISWHIPLDISWALDTAPIDHLLLDTLVIVVKYAFLLARPSWPRSAQHGILVLGRAMYVVVQIGESQFGFMSIYAPTHAKARSTFWCLLMDAWRTVHPFVDSWVVRGISSPLRITKQRLPLS